MLSPKVTRENVPAGSCLTQMSSAAPRTRPTASALPSGDSDTELSTPWGSQAESTGVAAPARLTQKARSSPPTRPRRRPASLRPRWPGWTRTRRCAIPSSMATGGPVKASLSGSKGTARSLPSPVTTRSCPGAAYLAYSPCMSGWASPPGSFIAMMSKSAGAWPACRSRKIMALAPGSTLGNSVPISFFLAPSDTPAPGPAGAADPGEPRVHLDVDVAIRAPVAAGRIDAVTQGDGRTAAQRDHPDRPAADEEAERPPVGGEEGAGAPFGAADRHRAELVVLPQPDSPAAFARSDVRHPLPVRRHGDVDAAVDARLQRLAGPQEEAVAVHRPVPVRAGASPRAPRPRPSTSAPPAHTPLRPCACAPVRPARRPPPPPRSRRSTGTSCPAAPRRIPPHWRTGPPAASPAPSAPPPPRAAGSYAAAVTSGRGLSVTTRATTACAVLPVNGGSPVSISYSTAPRA